MNKASGGAGQGGLLCCDSWGRKESVTTKRDIPVLLEGTTEVPGTTSSKPLLPF